MSSFDFGLQFLDSGRMTYWGKRRDASFWIENASIEWNEAQAPFSHGRTAYSAAKIAAHDGGERGGVLRRNRELDR